LPVRALSYKAVFSIQATKQFSNKSCHCAPSLTNAAPTARMSMKFYVGDLY
jgi:hypothetical protein